MMLTVPSAKTARQVIVSNVPCAGWVKPVIYAMDMPSTGNLCLVFA